jgi:hypothetical protein
MLARGNLTKIMAFLRRNLRVFVAAWLMVQAASLNALVPRDCCLAHRPAATSCHEPAVSATHCPMRATGAAPCAMHRGPVRAACALSSACDGPMAALFTLLSNHGTLPAATATLPDAAVTSPVIAVRENVTGRFEPPDSPPPRA